MGGGTFPKVCSKEHTRYAHTICNFFFNLSHFNSGQNSSEIKKNENLKHKIADKVASVGKGCVIVCVL